jgi:hypothetical protein
MDRWRPDTLLDPLERVPIGELISGAALVEGLLDGPGLASRCDVILWLIPPIDGLDLGSVRHLEFSTDTGLHPAEVGFSSVASGRPTCSVGVREVRGTELIAAAVAGVHAYSARRTAQNALWSAVPTLTHALRPDGDSGTRAFEVTADNGSRPRPTGALGIASRYLKSRLENAKFDAQWALAFRRDPENTSPLALFESKPALQELLPPPDRFWADPFAIRRNGRDYVFFEELIHERGLGHISVAELGEEGFTSAPVTVLERPFHLSYPFLLEHEGDVLLIPEMALEGRVEIFRATKFPYEWDLATTILEGQMLVDSTLAHINDKWWMFATVVDQCSDPSANLHLFYANSPYGPWVPHRMNPIRTDVRSSRPAGALFEFGGQWYRPSQDCSIRYGFAVQLQRIVAIDTDRYHEEPVARLNPTWRRGLIGTHTVNRAGGLTVLDLHRRVRKT